MAADYSAVGVPTAPSQDQACSELKIGGQANSSMPKARAASRCLLFREREILGSLGSWMFVCCLEVSGSWPDLRGPSSGWDSQAVAVAVLVVATAMLGLHCRSAAQRRSSCPQWRCSSPRCSWLERLWLSAAHATLVAGCFCWLLAHAARRRLPQVCTGAATLWALLVLALLGCLPLPPAVQEYPQSRLSMESVLRGGGGGDAVSEARLEEGLLDEAPAAPARLPAERDSRHSDEEPPSASESLARTSLASSCCRSRSKSSSPPRVSHGRMVFSGVQAPGLSLDRRYLGSSDRAALDATLPVQLSGSPASERVSRTSSRVCGQESEQTRLPGEVMENLNSIRSESGTTASPVELQTVSQAATSIASQPSPSLPCNTCRRISLAIPSAEWMTRQSGDGEKRKRRRFGKMKTDEGLGKDAATPEKQIPDSIEPEKLKDALLANLRRRRVVVGDTIGGARLEALYDAVAQDDPPQHRTASIELASVLGDAEDQDLTDLPLAMISAESVGVESFQAVRETILNKQSGKLMPAPALVSRHAAAASSRRLSGSAHTLSQPEVAPMVSSTGQSSSASSCRRSRTSSTARSPVDLELSRVPPSSPRPPPAEYRGCRKAALQGKNLSPAAAVRHAPLESQGSSSANSGFASGQPPLHTGEAILNTGSLESVEEADSSSEEGGSSSCSDADLAFDEDRGQPGDESPQEAAEPSDEELGAGPADVVECDLRESLAGLPPDATLQDMLSQDDRLGSLSLPQLLSLVKQSRCGPILEEGVEEEDQDDLEDGDYLCDELSLDELIRQELNFLILQGGLRIRGCKCRPGGPHTCMSPVASKLVSRITSIAGSLGQSMAQTRHASNEASRRVSLTKDRQKARQDSLSACSDGAFQGRHEEDADSEPEVTTKRPSQLHYHTPPALAPGKRTRSSSGLPVGRTSSDRSSPGGGLAAIQYSSERSAGSAGRAGGERSASAAKLRVRRSSSVKSCPAQESCPARGSRGE